MSKPFVLGIDPSGSYNEGKGTTGFALLDPEGKLVEHFGIEAKIFPSQVEYWLEVLKCMYSMSVTHPNLVYSVEDYVLYASSAKAQINSEMETSKLIGAIMVAAHQIGLPIFMRSASRVMNRWNNNILIHKKLINKKGTMYIDQDGKHINRHCLDAIRHAVHCHYFEIKEQ